MGGQRVLFRHCGRRMGSVVPGTQTRVRSGSPAVSLQSIMRAGRFGIGGPGKLVVRASCGGQQFWCLLLDNAMTRALVSIGCC